MHSKRTSMYPLAIMHASSMYSEQQIKSFILMFISILEGVFALEKKKENIYNWLKKKARTVLEQRKMQIFFFLDLSQSRTIKIILGDKNKR